jgi:hypothetical protein
MGGANGWATAHPRFRKTADSNTVATLHCSGSPLSFFLPDPPWSGTSAPAFTGYRNRYLGDTRAVHGEPKEVDRGFGLVATKNGVNFVHRGLLLIEPICFFFAFFSACFSFLIGLAHFFFFNDTDSS